MAHEIESAIYAREPAWHGLGYVFEGQDFVSVNQLKEYVPEFRAKVIKVPIAVTDPDTGMTLVYDDQVATIRQAVYENITDEEGDDHVMMVLPPKQLGIVGKNYHPYQGLEAVDFLDELIQDDGLKIESAGTLRGGKVIWILAQLPDDILIGGKESERHRRYIAVVTSHDGSYAASVHPTIIRLQCMNTVAFSLATASRMFSVKHTRNMPHRMKVQHAREALELEYKYANEWAIIGDQLVNSDFSEGDFEFFLKQLVPVPDDPDNTRGITRAENTHAEIRALYRSSPALEDVRNTKWAALNAVTEYSDHVRTSKETKKTTAAENRFIRSVLPSKTDITQRAYSLLTAA